MMSEEMKNISNNFAQTFRVSPSQAVVIGLGTIILAPTVLSLLKPVAKATLKTGVVFYEKTKASLAETSEVIEDIIAEAKAEVMEEQR
jgi:hypothetical protein